MDKFIGWLSATTFWLAFAVAVIVIWVALVSGELLTLSTWENAAICIGVSMFAGLVWMVSEIVRHVRVAAPLPQPEQASDKSETKLPSLLGA